MSWKHLSGYLKFGTDLGQLNTTYLNAKTLKTPDFSTLYTHFDPIYITIPNGLDSMEIEQSKLHLRK